MGASWAVNWAQKTQPAVVSKAFSGTNVTSPGQLLIGRGLPPLWLSYIDDFHVFAANADVVNKALLAGLDALAAAGFMESNKKRLNAQHERHCICIARHTAFVERHSVPRLRQDGGGHHSHTEHCLRWRRLHQTDVATTRHMDVVSPPE